MTATDFSRPATEDRIQRVAAALERNNIRTLVVDDAAAARETVLGLVPQGAEVHSGSSITLEQTGIRAALEDPRRAAWLRTRLFAMDRATNGREIRQLGAGPDWMLGSVAAVTETGELVAASLTGSQLGPYAHGAGNVIWVIGSQKIVATLEEALRRIHEHALAGETERLRKSQQDPTTSSRVNKILVIGREFRKSRCTVVLVRAAVGV